MYTVNFCWIIYCTSSQQKTLLHSPLRLLQSSYLRVHIQIRVICSRTLRLCKADKFRVPSYGATKRFLPQTSPWQFAPLDQKNIRHRKHAAQVTKSCVANIVNWLPFWCGKQENGVDGNKMEWTKPNKIDGEKNKTSRTHQDSHLTKYPGMHQRRPKIWISL